MADHVLNVVDGWIHLPSSLRTPAGTPRFTLRYPHYLAEDHGARQLAISEMEAGYEMATRDLLERTLQSGDCLIDVGAHWGYFSMLAATHPAGNIRAIAFEPDPTNAGILFTNTVANNLTESVEVVCVGCGNDNFLAPLVSNSTMMQSVFGVGLKPPYTRGPSKWVAILSLDVALGSLPPLGSARAAEDRRRRLRAAGDRRCQQAAGQRAGGADRLGARASV